MFSYRLKVFTIASVFLTSLTSASADPAYKADDVVNFFTKKPGLGLTRGICVGTARECDKEAEPPSTFDMLVTFDVGSHNLTQEAQSNLSEFAKALKDDRLEAARFAVEGHTDARGTDQYNLSLSVRRAEAVIGFLESQGIARERFEAKGFGETSPRVEDPLDAINRRVETRILLQ
ncbi:MAG: OmpA family protein [Pseudomonadota bacterium]